MSSPANSDSGGGSPTADLPLNPFWTFEEAVIELSKRHPAGGIFSGSRRNRLIEAWGQLVGRERALTTFAAAIDKYGSRNKLGRALSISRHVLRNFELVFEALPSRELLHTAGSEVGGWTLKRHLGSGGNGVVWLAQRKYPGRMSDQVAVKVIKNQKQYRSSTLERFRYEVEAHRRLANLSGVMPLIDSYTPGQFSKQDLPWLIMPVATPLSSYLKALDSREVFVGLISLAKTMADVHSTGVSHRDLKPDNLFVIDEHGDPRWLVSDFGIASFPEKLTLTPHDAKLGAIWYLPPEMAFQARDADGMKADVFSFAKTVWVCLSGTPHPPPGQLLATEKLTRLSTYVDGHEFIPALEQLLEKCTATDPTTRPTMRDVASEMAALLDSNLGQDAPCS